MTLKPPTENNNNNSRDTQPLSMSSPGSSESTWDQHAMEKRVRGNRDRAIKLLNIFLKTARDDLSELKHHIAQKDFEGIKTVAHKLKGSAGNLSANDLFHSLAVIEESAIKENFQRITDSAENLTALFEALELAFNHYIENP